MQKIIKRAASFLAALIVLVSLAPLPARAVDPVSITVANAWAQAVAAYGAANGVSMGFDVSNTDQIGEGVHELWDQYKQAIQDNDIPAYNDIALQFWALGYKKIGDAVGVDLSSSMVEALDGFWNWLLSGPAEMVKVDNQYQWIVDSQTGEVAPIVVQRLGNSAIPVADIDQNALVLWPQGSYIASGSYSGRVVEWRVVSAYPDVYAIGYPGTATSTNNFNIVYGTFTQRSGSVFKPIMKYGSNDPSASGGSWSLPLTYTYEGRTLYYYILGLDSGITLTDIGIPTRANQTDAFRAFYGLLPESVIALLPYGDVPGDITIPDNEDVNYEPLPVSIPLDFSWDPTRYGDGQTLTDAQKEAIEGDISGAIEQDGSLTIDEEAADDPTTDDPSETIGDLDEYTVPGLADVFPFCIPFDIYNFLSALAATPAAPHFTATLQFPQAVGGSRTIDLDFDTPTFNQLAQLLRLLELLAFIVGLAMLTRSMFLRG